MAELKTYQVTVKITCPEKFKYMLTKEALKTALNYTNRYIKFEVEVIKDREGVD